MVGRYISPLAQETHRRLWSDIDDSDAGILTRVLDKVDDWRIAPNGSKYSERFRGVKLVSASFLHASMRAPNSVYHELGGQWNYAIPSLIIGSKFKRNHMIVTNETMEQTFVNCALYYPANAGTTQLGMTEGSVDANGKGCHRDDMKKLCFKNNSCSELYNIDCSCDSSKVPPHMIGEYFTELFSNLANDAYFGSFSSRTICSYPGTEQGLKDMIDASNSLWKHRHGWCRFDEQECHTSSERKYRGHTECMASKNVMNVEMVDGILIQMPPKIFEKQVDLEQMYPNVHKFMLEHLQELHDWGYTELPIVFMEEIKGMSPEGCRRHWGGVDCEAGYRKEVYTQALNFSNGACIASPPGCNEVYYFPPDEHTGKCIPVLQNRTCLAEKHIMLPAQDQDNWQIVESGVVFPRILLMTQMSGVGYFLMVLWLGVLLNMKKIHRSGWRGRGYVPSHR
jgi:hypothetical protein